MDYYVYLNGVRRGPFAREKIRTFLADGLLRDSDLISNQGGADWKPVAAFSEFNLGDLERVAEASPVAQPPHANSETHLPLSALGPYARSTLAPNETPCYRTSLHWIIFARFALAGIVLFLFAAIPFAIAVQAVAGSEIGWFALPLPMFLLVPPALAFGSSEIVITDRRVLIKTGIIRRQTAEMFISKVESIGVEQGFIGRMLDYGAVRIRGTGGFEEAFDAIARPLVFRSWVQRMQSGEAAPRNR